MGGNLTFIAILVLSAFFVAGIYISSPAGSFKSASSVIPGPICSDTDGQSLTTRGTCSTPSINGTRTSRTDYCLDSFTVREFFCQLRSCAAQDFDCRSYGYTNCQNGACVTIVNVTHLACVSNNCASVSGSGNNSCSPEGSACGSYIDLTIISFSTGNISSNGSAYSVPLRATIKNIGSLSAGPSTTRFSVYRGSTWIGDVNLALGSLDPGSQSLQTANFSLLRGNYTGCVNADIYGVVTESNEANNQATISFTV